MITENYKEFQESLNNGDEYTTLIMKMQTYNGLDFENDELIYQSAIRQHNDIFKEDETHNSIKKKISKAKAELRNYEFDKNHNK